MITPDTPASSALVACCRSLAAAGLTPAAAGNVSVRVDDGVLVTRSRARLATLTEADLVLVSLTGEVLAGDRAPTSEVELHLGTYRARPDVGAVVHVHGRHSVALSTVSPVVPTVHYYCLDLGGEVAVAPYRTYGTRDLADVTIAGLGARQAVVMANHGSLTVGPDLATAAQRAELLEWLCEVSLL
ncbi:MAG: class II aldolase/adducin family protein, partial [Ornithinimicrobium sp.]